MLTGHYSYDLVTGLLLCVGAIAILALCSTILCSFYLSNVLNMQDTIPEGKGILLAEIYMRKIILVVRKTILFIIGYRGGKRERTPPEKVNTFWIERYFLSIIARFCVFYLIYIQILLIITRPVRFVGGDTFLYNYAKNPGNLMIYLMIYVGSNSIFDYLSIKYTLKHLDRVHGIRSFIKYGFIDITYAILFFIGNQSISCVLWYLKRREQDVMLTFDIIREFIDITLWPYAFVSNTQTGEMIGALFPGQLLITGTVFVPTLVIWCMISMYVILIGLSGAIKAFFRREATQRFCYKYLLYSGVNASNSEDGMKISFCNVVAMIIFNGVIASVVFEIAKAMASAFLV